MAAVVAARRQSPPNNVGQPVPRSSSPMDNKKNAVNKEEPAAAASSSAPESKPTQTSEPLAPPPRPAPADTPDYFSGLHAGSGNPLAYEPNPFEQSFGQPSSDTPGKSLLPPVAALTSPAIPGTSSTTGFNWANSLRSGPLSPAMLAGPAGPGDYFDGISRGFPTPNESSLRTGLTPGGGGSMFPAPSPNSQALFNQLQRGGATPGTLDFHRTAMNAAARSKNTTQFGQTSHPAEQSNNIPAMDTKSATGDHFANNHDAEAANGLFMLAKGGQGNAFAVPNQPVQPIQVKQQHQDMTRSRNAHPNGGSIGSVSGMSGPDQSVNGDHSDSHDEQHKAGSRGKGKKNTKAANTPNNRRKADVTPQKGSNKRAKGNNGNVVDPQLEMPEDDDDDVDSDDDENTHHKDGRKMTDEEKRKNFLERNRVAALKCRQRKKQWLANLQAKVEIFSSENDALSAQVTQLREEIVNLKTLLLAHKDCPISQAQGVGSYMNGMQDPNQFANPHANPYGMAMPNGMQAQMQRS